ncbi:hypothetical protein [Bradyrhizobium cenepequi]|uniref:hypothetical protein n=1 Tax=Bradyrhizobium cenepequi TaxID=2821403 RepID=UPI001CE2F52E|nr:hypothetical protein [Bradyrhizobium cenepequi]MCA6112950.1 hypothetical protein [Bradyrhizobium cenepequi]
MTENTTAPAIGKRHKRRAAEQMEMFVSGAVVGTPNWLELPDETRELLIDLMRRLILEHVRTATLPVKVGGGDER